MAQHKILLVEDNPGDARLAHEVLRSLDSDIAVTIAEDGQKAIACLRGDGDFREDYRPDLILLDLNLPRKDGREVLAVLKNDEHLRQIPVVVLTSSNATNDVEQSYLLLANCYVRKPLDFEQYTQAIESIYQFWFHTACLPRSD